MKKKKAPATVDRETEILRAAFRRAKKLEILDHVPSFSFFRPENVRTGFFEKSEVDAVITNLPSVIGDIVQFAFLSGWRRGEILPLRWEQVDRRVREVRLRTSKSGKPRTLPLEGELWDLIQKRWKAREYKRRGVAALSPYDFHERGKPVGDFRNAWAKACEAAKLPGRIFHDLRRAAVRNLIRAGVPQSVAMALTGHQTDSVFHRYDIVSDGDKREALRKTQDHLRKSRDTVESSSPTDFPGENTDKNTDKIENGSGPNRPNPLI